MLCLLLLNIFFKVFFDGLDPGPPHMTSRCKGEEGCLDKCDDRRRGGGRIFRTFLYSERRAGTFDFVKYVILYSFINT